jgi:hypothetical protein
MGSLTIDLFSSLDGFAASDGWPGYWGKEGPELMAWLEEKLAEDHTLVMGANTYREMSQIVAEGDDPTFERMSEIPKVVFSSTLRPDEVGEFSAGAHDGQHLAERDALARGARRSAPDRRLPRSPRRLGQEVDLRRLARPRPRAGFVAHPRRAHAAVPVRAHPALNDVPPASHNPNQAGKATSYRAASRSQTSRSPASFSPSPHSRCSPWRCRFSPSSRNAPRP